MPGSQVKMHGDTRPACLPCRDRKVKCDRTGPACGNCAKLGPQACIYPAPGASVRRKRGPYKKYRQREQGKLEGPRQKRDLVTCDSRAARTVSCDILDWRGEPAPNDDSISERLVQDALATITPSTIAGTPYNSMTSGPGPAQSRIGVTNKPKQGYPMLHHIWQLWHIYVTRVDPLTKIIHCPTMVESVFQKTPLLKFQGDIVDALLFSVFFAAVFSCTADECLTGFGSDRRALLEQFGSTLDAMLLRSQLASSLEKMQALLIYLGALRRFPNQSSKLESLFSVAVATAGDINLEREDQSEVSTFTREYRRRAWWMLCCLESGSAEEGSFRQTTIVKTSEIPLPCALDDQDLDPFAESDPRPRPGRSEMTFVHIFHKTVRLLHQIREQRDRLGADISTTALAAGKEEQESMYRRAASDIWDHTIMGLDASRPFDWLCINYARGMLLKARLQIEFPRRHIMRTDMSRQEQVALLYMSVELMKIMHAVRTLASVRSWAWYFREYVQWHCLAVVITTIGISQNKDFVTRAWETLAPMFVDWERVYSTKTSVPEWAYVHLLVQKARDAFCRLQKDGSEINGSPPAPDTKTSTAHDGEESIALKSQPYWQDSQAFPWTHEGHVHHEQDNNTYENPGFDDFDIDFSTIDLAAFDVVWEEWLTHDLDSPTY